MPLIEKIARGLCRSLWGDPDIQVVPIAAVPGPNGLSVVLPDASPMPAWNAYMPTAYRALQDVINEDPSIAAVLEPFIDEESKRIMTEVEEFNETQEPIQPDWRSKYGLN